MLTKLFVNAQLALEKFKKDERGVTAIEYAVIAVAISGIAFTVFSQTGPLKVALAKAITTIAGRL
ncbi:Flp family type IVb pilin [Vibrio penaeicida]|uniref:Fimbrial protein n=1 Tax=Vibrio penaeicida TaxID=104609 RepID=A0AAV5NPL4_9VIBR|nr:Flp family type IVb pilin [Vibrio penaeicida]RTZ20745.1 Flp family type IVb pilin [Vibrio penaeicida]GLQ72188.1 fimbrial protein [Vibrio penaeicida]